VKCVSDGADVTGVNIEDLASRVMLPSWKLIVICSKARFAYREPCGGARTAHVHKSALRPSTSLLADTSATSVPTEGATVEVKIGITDSPRELVFSSPQTPGEVEDLVSAALREGSDLVSLSDEKGRRFLIQTNKIAYVEIGAADARRVGFGIGAGSAARTGGKAAKSE
jgi:Protein of unknown function (DUF3107)